MVDSPAPNSENPKIDGSNTLIKTTVITRLRLGHADGKMGIMSFIESGDLPAPKAPIGNLGSR